MTHYFEKTIVESKDIYTDYLITTLSPLLYEGYQSLYTTALELEKKFIKASLVDPKVENPGVLVLFQHLLLGINNVSDAKIDAEYKRIRDNSRCADIFDNLIKAVIKSHIILLTYTASGKRCKIVEEKIHEKIEPRFFLHKCYIECSRIFYDHPQLFWHGYANNEIKENQRRIYQITKIGIRNAIRQCLPMKDILETYLNNDYVGEMSARDRYENAKMLINNELEQNKRLESSTHIEDNFFISEHNDDNDEKIDDLIFKRQVLDTLENNSHNDTNEHIEIIKENDNTNNLEKIEIIKQENNNEIEKENINKNDFEKDKETINNDMKSGVVNNENEEFTNIKKIQKNNEEKNKNEEIAKIQKNNEEMNDDNINVVKRTSKKNMFIESFV